jgi:hypothetical protein
MKTKIIASLAILAISSTVTFASYSAVIDYSKTNLDAANNLAEKKIIRNYKDSPEKYNLESFVLRQEIAAVAR